MTDGQIWAEFAPVIEKGSGGPGLHEIPLASARASMEAALIRWAGEAPPGCNVHSLSMDVPGRVVSARVYTPERDAGSIRPLIVVYHGGGFVMGSLDSQEALAHRIAIESDCVVVSVDYRLAPEYPYPAGVDDAFAAYSWLRGNALSLGADPARVGVWGESAGATIAAAVVLVARDRGQTPTAQFLAYPALCSRLATKSWRELGSNYWLTRDTMAWFWEQYLLGTEPCSTAYAEPLHAASLTGLPPTILVSAGLDPLKDEGAVYAAKLEHAGVRVVHHCVRGAIHGFLSMPTLSARADRLLTEYVSAFGSLERSPLSGRGSHSTASC